MVSPAQVYFGVVFTINSIILWAICKIIHLFPGDLKKRQAQCAQIAVIFFRLTFILTPWIKMPAPLKIHEAIKGRPIMVVFNHTSLADPLIITSLLDLNSGKNVRTLLKAALYNIPFFGGVCKMTGHFPVYFKSDQDGVFSVDREKQDKVMEEVEAYVKEGGTLLLFPEGQINKDPTHLQTFRKGSFNIAIKYHLPVYGCVIKGCDQIWPRKAAIGGFPASVKASLFPIADPNTLTTTEELCGVAEKIMQAEVDKLYQQEPKKTA